MFFEHEEEVLLVGLERRDPLCNTRKEAILAQRTRPWRYSLALFEIETGLLFLSRQPPCPKLTLKPRIRLTLPR